MNTADILPSNASRLRMRQKRSGKGGRRQLKDQIAAEQYGQHRIQWHQRNFKATAQVRRFAKHDDSDGYDDESEQRSEVGQIGQQLDREYVRKNGDHPAGQ